MAALRQKGTSTAVWILMGLLMFGLAGFGAQNFGSSSTAVGSVGDREITTQDYANALQAEIRAFSQQIGQPVTMQQALSVGLDRNVRAQLVNQATLDNEAARLGISVGDARVQRDLLAIPAFNGLDGRFDRAAYREALRRNGMNEAQFEAKIRDDAARTLVQAAVVGGMTAPQSYVGSVLSYITETRDARHIRLSEQTLPEPIATPDEATLRAWYEDHKASFTRPEAKRITYAWLTPEMLADKVEVDEAALRRLYDERIADFVQPERRLVERLAFSSDEEAAAVKARLDAGQITFEGLLAERRLKPADIDLGDVAKADLGAAGEAVFALAAPGIVGPLPSDFGPALFRMNGILASQNVPFEEAKADLSAELAQERARRMISDKVEELDDLLAGGATLEDLAKETDMELGSVDYAAGTQEGIAAYPAFRKAADAVQANDFPELLTLEDGGLLALRLDTIVPPTPIPYEDAAARVAEEWRHSELARRLEDQAAALSARIAAGEDIGALGLTAEELTGAGRDAVIDGVAPGVVDALFAMAEGEVRAVPGDGIVSLVRLERVVASNPVDPQVQSIRAALETQGGQSLAQDTLAYFTAALQSAAGIRLNETAINAVNAQFR